MDFNVQDSQGHSLARGSTDNPYQVRNILAQFLHRNFTLESPHAIHTSDKIKIWCSAELGPLLNPTPRIVNDSSSPFPLGEPTGPEVTLAQVCREHNLDPSRVRRMLRRHYGPKHVRYCWRQSEVPSCILQIKKV